MYMLNFFVNNNLNTDENILAIKTKKKKKTKTKTKKH